MQDELGRAWSPMPKYFPTRSAEFWSLHAIGFVLGDVVPYRWYPSDFDEINRNAFSVKSTLEYYLSNGALGGDDEYVEKAIELLGDVKLHDERKAETNSDLIRLYKYIMAPARTTILSSLLPMTDLSTAAEEWGFIYGKSMKFHRELLKVDGKSSYVDFLYAEGIEDAGDIQFPHMALVLLKGGREYEVCPLHLCETEEEAFSGKYHTMSFYCPGPFDDESVKRTMADFILAKPQEIGIAAPHKVYRRNDDKWQN